jgi:hypothetical protein
VQRGISGGNKNRRIIAKGRLPGAPIYLVLGQFFIFGFLIKEEYNEHGK